MRNQHTCALQAIMVDKLFRDFCVCRFVCRDETKFIKNNKIFPLYATNSSFQDDRPFVFKLHCCAMEKSILKSGGKQGNIALAMRREECTQKLIMKTKFSTDYLEYPVFHFNIQMK